MEEETERGQMRENDSGEGRGREGMKTHLKSAAGTGFRRWIEALCSRSAATSDQAGPGVAEP